MKIFDFEPLVQDKMPTTGSKVLRSLQNKETPLLDLLVRESIQNSLDASKNETEVSFVSVHFNTSPTPSSISTLFPELEKLQTQGTEMLEIRDTGTKGLTGVPFFTNSETSNFSKLVYDISNPQEEKDAGGSWGLGKTIYYRLGAGLVIFYSQVKNENGEYYEQRLAACFIENEKKPKRTIPNLESGIAWWGKRINSNSTTQAVEDPNDINYVLQYLGIKPFGQKETGTSIIIPFINCNRLIPRQQNNDEDNSDSSYDWFDGFTGYLASSIQRWYCLRLNNSHFRTGSGLVAYINEKQIHNSYPIFEMMQVLYNSLEIKYDSSIHKIEINNRNILTKETSGYLLTTKVDSTQLGMIEPDNHRSPFEHISCTKEGDKNPVILAFARKPGMIIGWQDPSWIGDMLKTDKGKYILALFVPNSDNLLVEKIASKTQCKTLEEYLRSIEKSDHSAWHDAYEVDIIKRIRRQVIAKINSTYNEDVIEIKEANQNVGLMRYLAKVLMPSDWGTDSRALPSKPSNIPKDIRSRNPGITITGISYPDTENTVLLSWSLYWGPKYLPSITLLFEVISENGTLSNSRWKSEKALGPYPCWIKNVELSSIKRRNPKKKNLTDETAYSYMVNEPRREIFDYNNEVHFWFTDNSFTIVDHDEVMPKSILNGKTLLSTLDSTISIQLNIKVETLKGSDK